MSADDKNVLDNSLPKSNTTPNDMLDAIPPSAGDSNVQTHVVDLKGNANAIPARFSSVKKAGYDWQCCFPKDMKNLWILYLVCFILFVFFGSILSDKKNQDNAAIDKTITQLSDMQNINYGINSIDENEEDNEEEEEDELL